jgi:hypothetical protein
MYVSVLAISYSASYCQWVYLGCSALANTMLCMSKDAHQVLLCACLLLFFFDFFCIFFHLVHCQLKKLARACCNQMPTSDINIQVCTPAHVCVCVCTRACRGHICWRCDGGVTMLVVLQSLCSIPRFQHLRRPGNGALSVIDGRASRCSDMYKTRGHVQDTW